MRESITVIDVAAPGTSPARAADHPALERLHQLERRRAQHARMGYQPSLDGIRAMSVIGVMLYHAGFSWMHGGFFGVEVFFVVSGFLITSLLIEERDSAGRVNLRLFWLRRFRRLLPALVAVLVVVGVWAVFWGTAEQHTQVRRDYPWALGYLANWSQIFSEETYFSGTPSLFRHLWSLAVEEQWYLLWPLTFLLIARSKSSDRRRGWTLASVAVFVMAATAVARLFDWPTQWFNPLRMSMQPVDTTNFLYLSTFTRCSGLLLGAAMAFLWRPWQVAGHPRAKATRVLDVAAVAAVGVLLLTFATGNLERDATYLWMLPLVTLSSAVLVAVVVHPWATASRLVFGSRPMAEIGKRSYGLYLWSWPISRVTGAWQGSLSKFVLAMAITVPVSEACYRFIETPIRRGALGTWWKARQRRNWNLVAVCGAVTSVVLVASLFAFYSSADKVFDAAKDTSNEVVFDPNAATGSSSSTAPAVVTQPAESVDAVTTVAPTTLPVPPVTQAVLPRRLVIVGDSTAHSLAINLPAGIESTFTIGDGSVEGCSVYDSGSAVSARDGFTRGFGGCSGWEQKWVAAAQQSGAQVAAVVIGAWDVFDVSLDGQVLPFGSAANDQRFVAGVQKGIDALSAAGVRVALVEVPCMRPQDVQGAGVPALPERGDDARVAHLNELLRDIAAANPTTTTFVAGPAEYCADESIASSLGHRWDGVHAYKPGAKLTFEAVSAALLAIPIP